MQAVRISLGSFCLLWTLFFISYILGMWPYFQDHFTKHFVCTFKPSIFLCMYSVPFFSLVGSHNYYIHYIIICDTSWLLQIQLTGPHQLVILPVQWNMRSVYYLNLVPFYHLSSFVGNWCFLSNNMKLNSYSRAFFKDCIHFHLLIFTFALLIMVLTSIGCFYCCTHIHNLQGKSIFKPPEFHLMHVIRSWIMEGTLHGTLSMLFNRMKKNPVFVNIILKPNPLEVSLVNK